MRSRISLRNLIIISAIILTIINSVYLLRPSALLKRSLLRRRLLRMPVPVNGTLRPKRQLFREDIPHHRPLTGNTYYLHAGFPHPSRWHEGEQLIRPNPNPITHHHHQHNNNNLHQDHHHDHGHHEHQQNHQHHEHDGPGSPLGFSFINSENPHSVTIQSAIVHNSGDGVIVDNSLGNHPPPPSPPLEQANFDPIHIPHSPAPPPPSHPGLGHIRHSSRKPKRPKPHSDPEQYDSGPNFGPGPAALHAAGPSDLYGPPKYQIQPTRKPPVYAHPPTRKPKTVIHYHPVSVGNIINFNDDNKPVLHKPHPTHAHTHSSSYGPPKHIPGVPLTHKDVMFSMAEPFLKTPFKTVAGPPQFLDDFNKLNSNQYGPPGHEPGPPLNSLGLAPMLPSYGPPLKPVDDIPPYGVALPVLAHFHSAGGHPPPHHRPHHRPPKRHRGRPQHHLHFHHIHHAPRIPHPSPFFDVKYPTYIVHGHVPHKYLVHHPHFSRRALLKSFWSI